jgi:hypothetical protein
MSTPTIDERYSALIELSTLNPQAVIGWSHISTADVRAAIVAILKQEYDAATFNTWAAAHGVPLLPV